ncbi:MAG: AI-2E family transporter [Candidatus Symbiobacter sp.]|nr:AI-2E family transporter [Candidatus Symbiobacter sp.]
MNENNSALSAVTTRIRPIYFWLAVGGLLLVLIWRLQAILLPFGLGATISYFLNPLVNRLARWRISRGVASLLLLGFAFSMLTLIAVMLWPLLQQQFALAVTLLPDFADQILRTIDVAYTQIQSHVGVPESQIQSLQQVTGRASHTSWSSIGAIIHDVISNGLAVVNLVLLVVITPIVSFYMLRDWPLIIHHIDSWIPRQHVADVRAKAKEINDVLLGFARGQALSSLVMAIYYGTALMLVGLPSGLLIGMVTGFLTFIPFFGTATGAGVSIILTMVHFHGNGGGVLYGVVGIFLLGAVMDGYIFQPLLVGNKVRLHPAWMIFALLAGGVLFGLGGILVSVPVAAILGVLVRYALEQYLRSSLFHSTSAPRHENSP